MRAILVTVLMTLASPALADDCRYFAPNGDKIAIDSESLVVFTKDDALVCEITGTPDDQMAACPTLDGEDEREIPFTINGDKLAFDGRDWLRRCSTPA